MRTNLSIYFPRKAAHDFPGYRLSPAQQKVCGDLLAAAKASNVFLLKGDSGRGKTSILRALHAAWGGEILSAGDFLTLLRTRTPSAIEETFLELMESALEANEIVLVDDFNLILNVVQSYEYPRQGLFDAVYRNFAGRGGAAREETCLVDG